MKVPPKRKGNCGISTYRRRHRTASMKVPPKRKGNFAAQLPACQAMSASMKVPPKRKGNVVGAGRASSVLRLNESPSEKEGK